MDLSIVELSTSFWEIVKSKKMDEMLNKIKGLSFKTVCHLVKLTDQDIIIQKSSCLQAVETIRKQTWPIWF